jgi:adenylate cyclase, class 2
MQPLNIAIKARCEDLNSLRAFLIEHQARFVGTDHQEDTYYHVAQGHLKLRQGTIENALVHHDRSLHPTGKTVCISRFPVAEGTDLNCILEKALGIKSVVNKKREIYFIDNVKFYLDEVSGLGSFIEIEAMDVEETGDTDELSRQCCHYREAMGIREEDILANSYSDLLYGEG